MNSISSLRGSALVLRGLIVVVLLSITLALIVPVAASSSTAPASDHHPLSGGKAGENLAAAAFNGPSVSGEFSATASMSQARASHVAIRLLDGRVLVAGGGSDLRTAEIYDPPTGTWSPTGSLTYGRYGQAAVLLSDGKVMVIGGVSDNVCSGPPVSNSAEIYNPATGLWTLTASMNISRNQALAIALTDGRVLVAGGGNRCGSVYTSAEIYDPATGAWAATSSMNVARELVRGVRMSDGRVLVAGGTGSYPFASLATAEIYDPATGVWTTTGTMNQPRLWGGRSGLVKLPNGLVLAVGGYLRYCDVGTCAPPMTLSTAELYNPSTGQWTLTGSLAHPRVNHETSLLASGQVLITGGVDSATGAVFDSAELYDPASGTFFTLPTTMSTTRQEHSATRLIDGRVLIAGGYLDGNNKLSAAEIYAETPPTSFDEEFNTSTLDPAWQVIEYLGPRVYGYMEPANHISLTDNSGYLRYYLDPMTIHDGFINDFQTTAYGSNTYDAGLELRRAFSGENWVIEAKAAYYMPFSNGRAETLRVYFGDGGAGTYFLSIERWRDGPWPAGTPETDPVLFRLGHKLGANVADVEWLETLYAPPSPGDVYYYRLERAGSVLTAKWSSDSTNWNAIFSHDLGPQLTGLQQVFVIAGHSWHAPAGSYADYDYIRLQPTDGANIAYNPTQTGYPHPQESDPGWGGGSYPWDMLDGQTYYTDTWAHGLAFTGGASGYIEPCGWRQATVDFGEMKTFNKIRVYHHGDEHIPTTYRVEYWNGSTWQVIDATSTLREDLRVPPLGDPGWGAVPTESVFSPVTGSKARFSLNNCDIEHGWIYEFEVYAPGQAGTGPNLQIPAQVPGLPSRTVTLPIQYTGNGASLATTVFSVDYDQACLQFDPTDADGDGNPDAVDFNLPAAFQGAVTYDGSDADGELDFFIGDTFPPLAALPDGTLATIQFRVSCLPPPDSPVEARVGFSSDPAASFGGTNGQSVAGTTTDGSVLITPIAHGDCNADSLTDAGDISATVLEIFDGDGNLPQNAPNGTFPGNAVGCNANNDTVIDAGDISCTVLLIFNGQTACGSFLRSPAQDKLDRPLPAPSLQLLEAKNTGDQIIVPIQFEPGGFAISSLVFALDYNPALATIDPTDADDDGVPDAVAFDLPSGFQATATLNNETGLLEMMIADVAAPLSPLPEQIIARVTWQIKADGAAGDMQIEFAKELPASFGDVMGRSIPGEMHGE